MLMVTLRIFISRPIPISIWLPGSVLTIATFMFPLIYSLEVNAADWLDLPVVLVWLLFVVYCGFIAARITMVRQYGWTTIISLAAGATFRYVSYRVIGPLYANTESVRGIRQSTI